MGSERISPTAHYTGQVWVRNGLSHPALDTAQGRLLYQSLRPLNAGAARLRMPTLEGLLLARHHAIDSQLDAAIASGQITQVIEIAAGLSPRGWDFARRHGERITYVEADLPAMAQRKRKLLERAGLSTPAHRVVALDALAESGPLSLGALADSLDHSQGLAIITEGLLNYFPEALVRQMWRSFAVTLRGFPRGLYLSDLHLRADMRGTGIALFTRLLSTFVRGRVSLHFDSVAAARDALLDAGFDTAELPHPPPQASASRRPDKRGANVVRVIRATRSVI